MASWGFVLWAPLAVPAALFSAIMCAEYIRLPEPLHLTSAVQNVRSAIIGKALQYSWLLTLLFLPQTLIFSIYTKMYTPLLVYAVLLPVQFVIIMYAASIKYLALKNDSAVSWTVRMTLFLLISPLLPVSVWIAFKTYKNAKCKLNQLFAFRG